MKPWEPQPNESMPAFAAFAEYRDLGPERSLEAVRVKIGKSTRLITRWSSPSFWNWVERAKAFDAHIDSIKLTAREQSSAKQAQKIMSADEVKQGLTKIAEFDVADLFEADGTFNLAEAKRRGVTKQIKTINFDKDTGRVVKLESYSAHEGYRDVGKTYGIFKETVETADITEKDPATILMAAANELHKDDLNYIPVTYERAKELIREASERKLKAVS